ncbi:hypothetical protein [Dyella sp. 2HG41-7]|uniref:hypothetical protein n=1 Tax=Dyella sp. 2HG41-7 TaxID=2883239 RepID=UPI001F238515|nr:hypothetical protein [Dyella sp. 2HG41-7]
MRAADNLRLNAGRDLLIAWRNTRSGAVSGALSPVSRSATAKNKMAGANSALEKMQRSGRKTASSK